MFIFYFILQMGEMCKGDLSGVIKKRKMLKIMVDGA